MPAANWLPPRARIRNGAVGRSWNADRKTVKLNAHITKKRGGKGRSRLAARLPSVVWLAALLGATFVLARRAAGEPAALIATAGTALDPSLVAHGSLATVDVPYVVATLATLATVLGFARAPSPRRG